ncbi:MAG: hypothetical protein ABI321_22495 [Polyangia bacterium]
MRRPAFLSRLRVALLCATTIALGSARVHATPPTAVFWAPEPAPSVTATARKLLAHALAARGIALDDSVVVGDHPPMLAEALAAAIEAYRTMQLEVAADALRKLAAEAARTGGGDLDRRGLGDLFLNLGLTEQELGHVDAAWDAFVASANLDPSRMLDPARVPPRAAAVYRRAVTEHAKSAPVAVSMKLPPGAALRIDGEALRLDGDSIELSVGTHYVQIESEGNEPWVRTITVVPPQMQLAPTPTPQMPPQLDTTVRGAFVQVALYRPAPEQPLRIRLRARNRDGRITEASDVADRLDERRATSLVDTVLGAPLLVVTERVVPARRPIVRAWWLWTAVGVGVAALTTGLAVGFTRGHGDHAGTVSGKLVPLP